MTDSIIRDFAARKWAIAVFAITASLITLIVSLFLPDQYLSQASLLPANSKLMDKQRIFENNIQELYSAYGNAEDLDRLFATMHSGTVIHHVADSLKLVEHYGLNEKKNAKALAQKKLAKNIKLLRTEYGELHLSVWDKDPAKAEQIANAIVARTQDVFDAMFRSFYDRSISSLKAELTAGKPLDDSALVVRRSRQAGIEQKIDEYEITRLNPPAAFFVMEKPSVSSIPDKPRVLLNIGVSFIASMFTIMAWIAAKRAMNP